MADDAPVPVRHGPQWARAAGRDVLQRVGTRTARARPWPNFLIIGTKRGGTTSVFRYLLAHPDVRPMWPARQTKSTHYFDRHYDRGPDWFRGHFATSAAHRLHELTSGRPSVSGEASPYYLYDPRIAERVRADAPATKILIFLRDPVNRAYSQYWERVDNGAETLTFEEALAAEPERLAPEVTRMSQDPLYYSQAHDFWSYRDRGVYTPQVRRWMEHFPSDQLLIVRSEDYHADAQAVADTIVDFLGIRRHPMPPRSHHNRRPASPMRPDTRAELAEFYAAHNASLYDLLGRDFEWQ